MSPVKQSKSNQAEEPQTERMKVIESLLDYPSLEKVFDSPDSRGLSAMKQKMQATVDDLERVIRRGTKADAEKAAKVAEAYKTVMNFLDELENRRQAHAG